MKTSCLLLFLLAAAASLSAQRIEYPETFHQRLKEANIEFFEPLDAGYKDVPMPENPYHSCHFAIRSRTEALEIRYSVHPWATPTDDLFAANPHILTQIALNNVAVNDSTQVISVIQLDTASVREEFNADWGMAYFFKPKPAFSAFPQCRMLALCKEEQATVLIFFLFDDAGNVALDQRYLALRFL